MNDSGLRRFAYSEDTGDDVDEEVVALTGTGIKVAADLSNKLERKERKAPSTTADHPVFGLGGDLEEDKRE